MSTFPTALCQELAWAWRADGPSDTERTTACVLQSPCAPSDQGTTQDAPQVAPAAHMQPRSHDGRDASPALSSPHSRQPGLPERVQGRSPALAGAPPQHRQAGSPARPQLAVPVGSDRPPGGDLRRPWRPEQVHPGSPQSPSRTAGSRRPASPRHTHTHVSARCSCPGPDPSPRGTPAAPRATDTRSFRESRGLRYPNFAPSAVDSGTHFLQLREILAGEARRRAGPPDWGRLPQSITARTHGAPRGKHHGRAAP